MVIVKRFDDEKRIKKASLPLLVYGRRKTGKTFLVKYIFKDANYFFVRRDKTIFYEKRDENIRYDELVRIIEENKGTIIIDEFHRLGEDFLEFLHIKQPKNLILITSTLNLARKLITQKSPILGLFMEFRLDLISEKDILKNMRKCLKGKELIENCVYLREPLLLRFFKNKRIDFNYLKLTIPALIGEIFGEEGREISSRYEGILRAIATGKNTVSEIVSYLYSYRLIDKEDSSVVKQYLKNLIELGLITRIKDYFRNRWFYFIASPVIDLYYYLDEKYNFSENELGEKYFKEKVGKHVEHFFRDLLSKILNKRSFIISKPDHEIDIALADFNKLRLVGEVKWKNRISRDEIMKIEENLKRYGCERILIVPSKRALKKSIMGIKVLDVDDVVSLVS